MYIASYDKNTGINLVAAETILEGQMCCENSDGKAALADANGSGLGTPLGAAGSGAAANERVTLWGRCEVEGLSSLTKGARQYLSATAGGLTESLPADASIITAVGVALTTTKALIDCTQISAIAKQSAGTSTAVLG